MSIMAHIDGRGEIELTRTAGTYGRILVDHAIPDYLKVGGDILLKGRVTQIHKARIRPPLSFVRVMLEI